MWNPTLKTQQLVQQFQFQRLGYFNVDKDQLRTPNWCLIKPLDYEILGQKKPKSKINPHSSKPHKHSKRKAIDVIKQLGKKYTNLPEENNKK